MPIYLQILIFILVNAVALFVGMHLVRSKTVKYETKLNNEQNTELMELIKTVKEIKVAINEQNKLYYK